MYRLKYLLIAIFSLMLLNTACNKKKVEPEEKHAKSHDISTFIWQGMNFYYLWYKDVPKLGDDHFKTNNDWYGYLNGFGTKFSDLFNDLRYKKDEVDKWSWIVDDWVAQENRFSGISKSMGYNFRLLKYGPDLKSVLGYVRYVLPGSPADIKGIKRGDIFTSVNETDLTLSNYENLLFTTDTYTLGFSSLSGNTLTPTLRTVTMTAVIIKENPVSIRKVMDIGDGMKTAYLMYNSFTSNYDTALNNAFASFKSQAVDRLILDLRYNGGGSVRSAIHLASMIHSIDTNKLFSKSQYNDKVQAYYLAKEGPDYLNYYFAEKLDTTTISHKIKPDLSPIYSLGLSEIYIIATGSSASASELVINGLLPYMTVHQVGGNTHGKYVGSFTIKDFYTYDGKLNTDHKWAMQPITLKIANSAGTSDYIDGLAPEVEANEDISDLKPLGDPTETLLAATIKLINPSSKSAQKEVVKKRLKAKYLADSKDFVPFSSDMYIRYPELDLIKNLTFEPDSLNYVEDMGK